MAEKVRLKYIDIAKGILICCLLYGHMVIFARMEGLEDPVMGVVQKSLKLYAGFFMQSFFFITGFCSSFNKDFKTFLWNNIKTILIPAILLIVISDYGQALLMDHSVSFSPITNLGSWLLTGGPWFIITMFWGKIAYWFIHNQNLKRQMLIISVLYLLGIILNILNVIPNYWYHRHVLLMLPYLFLGNFCKSHKAEMDKYMFPLAMCGLISILSQFILSQFVDFYSIPVHDDHIGINKTFPIHIVNAITGTAFVLFVSKKVGSNHFLEIMGKGTLLIYLWNGFINRLILNILPPPSTYYPDSIVLCVIYHTLVYVAMLAISYVLIRLVYDTKYLRWIVGKW